MRVIHTIPALFSKSRGVIGGAERYALELARHMSREVPTTLLSFSDGDHEHHEGDLRIRLIGNSWHIRGDRMNPFAPELVGEILKHDVLHAHHQHLFASSLGAATARLSGRKAFVSDLGGGGWDISGYISTDSWYDAHLHISEYSRRVFGHERQANAQVIYGGVDIERFKPSGAPSNKRALFVGRLLPHKGVDYLIEAIGPGLALDIAGWSDNGEYISLLRHLARGRDVKFLGSVPDEELPDLYRQSMCVVLPSVHEPRTGGRTEVPELLGQTLLEGMSSGRPAICTRVASMPEIVTDECGYIVEPNDPDTLESALRKLSEDESRCREAGAAARRRVEDMFTWDNVVKKCLAAYESARS